MLDVAFAYKRFDFLGNEFLTWLWYAVETEADALRRIDPQMAALEIGNRLVLENQSHQTTETVTIRGDDAGMEEGILALRKGALVVEMNLIYRSGDERWDFSVKGENLNLTAIKVPETGRVETSEDIEAAAVEKVHLCQRPVALVQSLFTHFIHLRLENGWTGTVLPAFRRWMQAKER
jgi:hypothetical protein